MTASGLPPRTVRCTHTVLRMVLDHAIDDKMLYGKNPAARVRFVPLRETTHVYLTAAESISSPNSAARTATSS
jgi:hypothetical protein